MFELKLQWLLQSPGAADLKAFAALLLGGSSMFLLARAGRRRQRLGVAGGIHGRRLERRLATAPADDEVSRGSGAMSQERRGAPRFDEQLRVLTFSRQLSVRVAGLELLTANLSLTGMQLVCPKMQIAGIQSQLDEGMLLAEVELPDKRSIAMRCRVAYASPYGDEVLIGTHIEAFEGAGEDQWRAYLTALATERASRNV